MDSNAGASQWCKAYASQCMPNGDMLAVAMPASDPCTHLGMGCVTDTPDRVKSRLTVALGGREMSPSSAWAACTRCSLSGRGVESPHAYTSWNLRALSTYHPYLLACQARVALSAWGACPPGF